VRKLKIIGVDIFLEKRKTRLHVGVLGRAHKKIAFTYDDHYFEAKNIIPLGPEFPMTQKEFFSDKLFPSLEDRIPSQQNPAYSEYCQSMGIDPSEKDPFILLSTIGKKGPSSFIFSPRFEREIKPEDLIEFRKALGFTTRDFARVFEFSQTSINALEIGKTSGKDILKRIEILLHFPAVALEMLMINSGHLHYEKWAAAVDYLKKKPNDQSPILLK
jgi:HipA-like protein